MGLHPVRLAQQQLREGHRIDPEVQQGAAAQRGIAQPVLGAEVTREAEVGLYGADLADRPVPHQFRHPPDDRVAVRPHGLHQEEAAVPGELHQLPGLALVDRERLLAQHVLPGLQGEGRRLPVRGVRCGHVHHVDVLVGDERRPVPVRPRYPEPLRERLRRGVRTGGHGHHLRIGHRLQVRGESRRDPTCSQHAPTDSPAHARSHKRCSTIPAELRA